MVKFYDNNCFFINSGVEIFFTYCHLWQYVEYGALMDAYKASKENISFWEFQDSHPDLQRSLVREAALKAAEVAVDTATYEKIEKMSEEEREKLFSFLCGRPVEVVHEPHEKEMGKFRYLVIEK